MVRKNSSVLAIGLFTIFCLCLVGCRETENSSQVESRAIDRDTSRTESEIQEGFERFASRYMEVWEENPNRVPSNRDLKLVHFSTDFRANDSIKYPYLGIIDVTYTELESSDPVKRVRNKSSSFFIYTNGKWDYTTSTSDGRRIPLGKDNTKPSAQLMADCNEAAWK